MVDAGEDSASSLASSAEGSHMLSSSTDCGSSDASSSAGCSPACSPRPAGPAAAQPPASRRVPPLSLRANLADLPRGGNSPPEGSETCRRVPRLAIPPLPASASGGAPPPAATALQLRPPPPLPAAAVAAPSGQAALLSLDILSPALGPEQLQQAGGDAASTADLRLTCAHRLGVAPERLRFYALTEVSSLQQLPPGCTRAAVEVIESRFSLAALEELLKENQRLAAAGASQAGAGRAAGGGGPQQNQQLAAQLRQLQLENEALRRQLQLSEGLRRRGCRALKEVKQEFDELLLPLLLGASGAAEHKARHQQLPLLTLQECATPERAGTPAAVADAQLLH